MAIGRRRFVVSFGVLIGIIVCVIGFCFLKPAVERSIRERADARAEALIDKLARPVSQGSWVDLRDMGLQAFPKAIEHLHDKRTSFTADSGSTDETWTVGRACFDVLWCNLEPYNCIIYSSCIPPKECWWRPHYCREFLTDPEKAEAWLAAHEGKSLVDLQIEVLEWVTTNRSKRKFEISVEDRQELLYKLDALRQSRKSLEPAIPWSK